jgi:uncharacterized protein YwqG
MREQIEKIAAEVFAHEHSQVKDIIIRYLSPCIAGKINKGTKAQIGQSKMGGIPTCRREWSTRSGRAVLWVFAQLNFTSLSLSTRLISFLTKDCYPYLPVLCRQE